ncbi:MAG: hypothetical protein K6F74_02430 [Prevotella sp.]|nr:hypothetical protein [Prevotella sp.]
MEKNHQIATGVATENVANATNESVNAADYAASINQKEKKMKKENEAVAPMTRVAIIDGEEKTIWVAHTKYAMELPKDKKELCKKLDPNKMLSVIYHFTKPELFWREGYDLYDENGNIIEKGTPNVLVHVQTSEDYWRVGLEERLEKVEMVEFSTVQEYAQTVGCTNLYSRGMTDTEKVGMAALSTGNKAYQAVYEFAKEHKLNLTTARQYLDVSMDKAQIMEMSIGLVPENAPKQGRTKKQAADLLKLAEKVFGKNARKRYVIRPLNSLSHQDYSSDMIKQALKAITESEAIKVEASSPDDRESLVSNLLTRHIQSNPQTEDVENQEA